MEKEGGGQEMSSSLQLVASFIPARERASFLNLLIEACGRSIWRASREAGVSRSQIYRYLGACERKEFPDDEVMARILTAGLRMDPIGTRTQLRNISRLLASLTEAV